MTPAEQIAALQAENAALRQQIAALQAQLAAALQRIAELEQRPPAPPAVVKPNTSPRERPPRRKRRPEHNKARRLEVPTRIIPHALDRCPDCHQRLQGGTLARRRQVIELPPPPPVEVIEHQVFKRWCAWCHRWRTPSLDLTDQVLGQGRLGLRLTSLIAYLRSTRRLPIRRLRAYLQTVHQLTLSTGELVELLHRVRRAAQPALDALKAQARASPILHADETGWREAGQNGYVWGLSTPGPTAVRYYEYHRSRAGAIARQLVGMGYGGLLVIDFYAGYNQLPGRKQRCWVHLLRDLRALQETHGQDVRVRQWAVQVGAVYQMARQRLAQAPALTPAQRAALYARLVARVAALGRQYAQVRGHACQALAKRLLRHQDELFPFVLAAGLPAENNLAERSLRAVVVVRKISGGTQSAEGSTTRLGLASLFETWQARALNPFTACLHLLRQTPLPQI